MTHRKLLYYSRPDPIGSLFGSPEIDRSILPTPEYWVPIVAVAGGQELVGDAFVPTGAGGRLAGPRGEALAPMEAGAHA